MYWRGFLIFLFLLFSSSFVQAQRVQKELVIHCAEEERQLLKKYQFNKMPSDAEVARNEIAQLIIALQKEGYFTAQASELSTQANQLITTLKIGKQYTWAKLSAGNISPLIQDKTGFREKFFLNKPFHYQEVAQLMENVLQYAENTGYPFATIRLTNVSLADKEVTGSLDYQSGPFITFGHLVLNDSSIVKPAFLAAYLGVKSGTPYQQQKINHIESMLSELPYLNLEAPVRTSFQNESTDIYLEISGRRSNQMDGVISFLPSEGKEGKLLLTGEVNLLLNNLFRTGKTLALQWQRLQVLSQQLMMYYEHTNLLKSPLDVSLNFDFLKEDTLFVNRDFRAELSFRKNAYTKIGIFTNLRSSRLLGGQGDPSSPSLILDYADYNLTNYGIKYTWKKLNHHLFPKKGITVTWEASAGKKKLRNKQNPDDPDVSDNSWQYTFSGSFSHYYPIGKNLVLYNRLQGGTMQNEQLFFNDLWRIGGLHSLRGFNEKFFFAASYALSNLELRLLFDKQQEEYSCLFLFYDQAYIVRESYSDYPSGIGAGISLVTKTGIFNLAYALGNAKVQPMNLSISKIHFGYIGRF